MDAILTSISKKLRFPRCDSPNQTPCSICSTACSKAMFIREPLCVQIIIAEIFSKDKKQFLNFCLLQKKNDHNSLKEKIMILLREAVS